MVAVLIAVAAALFLPTVQAVCIENADTGALLGVMTAKPNEEFYVSFRHSVNKTEVREYYTVSGSGLMLTHAEYSSFGAGMPEVPEQPGSTLKVDHGVLKLVDINQPMDQFIYRVGTVAEHTLHTGTKQIPLATLAVPQTPLKFSCHRISAFSFLRRHV